MQDTEVRLSVDLTSLVAEEANGPRSFETDITANLVRSFAKLNEITYLSWYNSLREFFQVWPDSADEARKLLKRTDHRSQIMLGFDIHRSTKGGTPNSKFRQQSKFISSHA
jgi:hypothetical protein